MRCIARIIASFGGTGRFFKNLAVSAPMDDESDEEDCGFFSNLIFRFVFFDTEFRFGGLDADFRFGAFDIEPRLCNLVADFGFGDSV